MSGGQAGSSSRERLAASHRNELFSGGSEDKPCWRVVAALCSSYQRETSSRAANRNKRDKDKKQVIR